MTTYPQGVNSLLRFHATHGNITNNGDEITMFTQPGNKTYSKYVKSWRPRYSAVEMFMTTMVKTPYPSKDSISALDEA